MVTLLPSSATRTIQVITAEVGTLLDIFAPDQITQGVSFRVTGTLRRVDNLQVLQGEEIIVSVNGTELGRDTTTIGGDYLVDAVLPNIGTFTLEAKFLRSVRPELTLGASRATTGIRTISTPQGLLVAAVAPILAGALLVYMRG